MIFEESHIDIETPTGMMRTHVYTPLNGEKKFPGIILYSEIYQVTGPIARLARFFAGHGMLVYVPEVYHEYEPLGTVFKYDKEDTEKGNNYKHDKPIESFDSDTAACIDLLLENKKCNGNLGAFGVCLGGHLSLRAGLDPRIKAIVCAYGTNIHDSSLGKNGDDTITRLNEVKASCLMIWGRQDPHISPEGRSLLYKACQDAKLDFSWHTFNAQHAFLRDEGARFDPWLTKASLDMSLEIFHRSL